MINLTKNLYIINKKMKENEKELVDLDEEGNVTGEKIEKKPKKNDYTFKIIVTLIIIGIIVLAGILVYKQYNKMSHIELIVAEDYDEMSRKAANIIADLIKKNPNAILGLATGSTPVGTYNELIQKNKNKEISFQNVTTFNLDEYIDLDKNHPQSYYTFMYEHLFKNIDINLAKTHIPKGQGDPKLNVQNYENLLHNNKINLQILGVGRNGHIGFNEPGTPFDMGVHDVELHNKTIKDNARFFENDISKVPKKAITMGIRNILDSETIILMANGTNKADAIKYAMNHKVDVNIPVTALQKHKGKVYVIVDKKAASKL
jgi:glucosamine-6-phosphate deaminase